jgi:hypothetical protein
MRKILTEIPLPPCVFVGYGFHCADFHEIKITQYITCNLLFPASSEYVYSSKKWCQ